MRIGGLVIARQRPGTAKGITFMLLEDERGTVNIIVSPQIYERDRLTVRTEPLVIVDGRLERHASAGGAINIVARRVTQLEVGDRLAAQVKDFSILDAIELARQAQMPQAARRDGNRRLPRGRAAGHELRRRAAAVMRWARRSGSPGRRPLQNLGITEGSGPTVCGS